MNSKRDEQLAELLLLQKPKIIILVGEPMFRLSEALSGQAGNGETPRVQQVASHADYKALCSTDAHGSAERVTCISLSHHDSNADHLLGSACRLSPRLVIAEVECGKPSVEAGQSAQNQSQGAGQILPVKCDGEVTNSLEDEQFYAHGFKKLFGSDTATGANHEYGRGAKNSQNGRWCRWYGYSLSDYKQAPDWLNARFWAHPERFDIFE